jgi:hypothetical protein
MAAIPRQVLQPLLDTDEMVNFISATRQCAGNFSTKLAIALLFTIPGNPLLPEIDLLSGTLILTCDL